MSLFGGVDSFWIYLYIYCSCDTLRLSVLYISGSQTFSPLIWFCPRALHLLWFLISDVLLQKPMTEIVLRSGFVLLMERIILKITDSCSMYTVQYVDLMHTYFRQSLRFWQWCILPVHHTRRRIRRWWAELWSEPRHAQSRRGNQNERTSAWGQHRSLKALFASVSVIVSLCLFALLSISLPGCLSISLQTGFCQSLSTPQAPRTEQVWKCNQRCQFMSLNAVKKGKKKIFRHFAFYFCVLCVYVCVCVCVQRTKDLKWTIPADSWLQWAGLVCWPCQSTC